MSPRDNRWPLDRLEHLVEALREPGVSESEAEELAATLIQLAEWRMPVPTAEETRQLVARLQPYIPAPSPVRQVLRARPRDLGAEFGLLIRLVRAQVSILRPAFWLVSALVVVLGGMLVFSGTNLNQSFVLQTLGPLLSYLGTVSAFRGSRLHILEFELACPPSPRQLTLARLVIILGYDIALGLALTLVLWSQGEVIFGLLILHWLAPLLFGVGLTLLLSLRLPINQASAMAYLGWMAALVLSLIGKNSVQETASLLSGTTELALTVVGLILIGGVVLFMPKAMPRLLPRI